jgi:hypothetical protein
MINQEKNITNTRKERKNERRKRWKNNSLAFLLPPDRNSGLGFSEREKEN